MHFEFMFFKFFTLRATPFKKVKQQKYQNGRAHETEVVTNTFQHGAQYFPKSSPTPPQKRAQMKPVWGPGSPNHRKINYN